MKGSLTMEDAAKDTIHIYRKPPSILCFLLIFCLVNLFEASFLQNHEFSLTKSTLMFFVWLTCVIFLSHKTLDSLYKLGEPILILTPHSLSYERTEINKKGKAILVKDFVPWELIQNIIIESYADISDEGATYYLSIDSVRIRLDEIALSPRELCKIFENYKPIVITKKGWLMQFRLSYFFCILHQYEWLFWLLLSTCIFFIAGQQLR